MSSFYSEDWFEANTKFKDIASKCGVMKMYNSDDLSYEIPYVFIGNGPNKIVINSGVHGIEGYFGSAAQIMFLHEMISKVSSDALKKYTIVLIHVINGWGMQNRMREVFDNTHGGLVDLNRNFGLDFSHPEKLPQNPKYKIAHDLLISKPDKTEKKNAIKSFRQKHLKDGVWAAISNGQYYEPYGLFYGGCAPMSENIATMHIYDEIMSTKTDSLISIGMHTGLGRFYRKQADATSMLLVSHPEKHKNTLFFNKLFAKNTNVVPDNNAVNGPVILGDLVDCLEQRYANKNIPIYTADFEIGTGEFPIMSPIYKRMDMGDARYDLLHFKKINSETWGNLTESWYPSDLGWKNAALRRVRLLFDDLIKYMNQNSK